MQRLNKEYKLNINDNFIIKYGTVDRNNPQVLYITGKTWIKPSENANYEEQINDVKDNFKKRIQLLLKNNNLFDKKFVCDFEVNTISITTKKKNYISFVIFFKQKSDILKTAKDLENDIKYQFNDLFNKLNQDFNYYNFKLTKSK